MSQSRGKRDLAVGATAIVLIVLGQRFLPGRPVALGVVALAIVAASVRGLPALGVATTGDIPSGLPTLAGPALRLRDVEGILPLAAGCLLLAYIESVSAAASRVWTTMGFFTSRASAMKRRKTACCTSRGERM